VTPQEVQELLLEASAFDGRMVTEETVTAWHRILRDLQADQAMRAMRDHFSTEDRKLMPVHVVQGVKKIREALMRNYQGPGLALEAPDVHPDNVMEYLAEGIRLRGMAGNGVVAAQAPQLMARIGRLPGYVAFRETTPMVVACANEECRALVGRQCRTRKGETRVAHSERIDAFRAWKDQQESA
jgi:hypothetical protein